MTAIPTPAVLVENVSKVFMVPSERHTSLKRHVLNAFRQAPPRRFRALESISMNVAPGEFFGIIGHNGSGKSTLLKILARIYQPTRGRVAISGRLSPFIELGVGFNPELTARENVYLNGAILGLTHQEVADRFEEIIGFAELEQFVDQKLKNFSSGMLVRLAFAVAIQAHAEILLIDEVLAVGDSEFQRKCFDVFRKFKAEGKTIIFVSHDLGSIREFSDRVLLLDHGVAIGIFPAETAIARYQQLNEERANQALVRDEAPAAPDSERVHLVKVRLLAANGEETHVIHRDEPVSARIQVSNPERLPLNVGLAIYRTDGFYCLGTNTFLVGLDVPSDPDVGLTVDFPAIPLQRGSYQLTVGLFGTEPSRIYQMAEGVYKFQVTQQDGYDGFVLMPHEWSLDPGTPSTRRKRAQPAP